MTRSRYQRGAAFEREVLKRMRDLGWVAIRSPGSKTPVDVYCMDARRKVFIQCKTNGDLRTGEWNEFYRLSQSVDAMPVLAMRGARGKGIQFRLLLGERVPYKRKPMVEWIATRGERRGEVQDFEG